MFAVWPCEGNQFLDEFVRKTQPLAIHPEKLFPLVVVGPIEHLNSPRTPHNRWVERLVSVRAEQNEDTSIEFFQVVDLLDQRIDPNLVFMVALSCVASSGERIPPAYA